MKKRRSPATGTKPMAAEGTAGAGLFTHWPVRLAALFCATLLAYWPAVQGQLLWDDDQHVTRLDLQPLNGLWRIWSDVTTTQQFYPFLHSMFWVEHRIWGDSSTGYHLTNIALHSISALLVMLIVERLKLPGAWLAGFLFALHPVCVESVAWISEQKNTLSGVFYLASTLAYLQFDQNRRKSKYVVALLLFLVALLSKSSLAALPAILLVILWWRRGRLEWRRDLLPLVPWFAAAIGFGLVTYSVEEVHLGAQGVLALTLLQRLLLASRTPWFYASKVLLPFGLVFIYPFWKIDPTAWWQYLFPGGLLLAIVALALAARRNRGPMAAFLIFGGALFPVLGLMNAFYFRYSYVADHSQYLPCLAILIPAAAILERWLTRPAMKRWHAAIPAALLVCLGGFTWAQSTNYTDDETLYRSILARNPESWLAHNNLGLLLIRRPGGLPEAVTEYRAAIRAEPEFPESHFNLGSALAHSGPQEQSEALAEYRTAIRLKPNYVEAHYNLANLLSTITDRTPEAIAEYREALRLEPGLAEAHANLGNALAQTPGRLPDAIGEYETALRLKPGLTMQRFNLANALTQTPSRLPEAIQQYETALQAEPGFAQGHLFLAQALSEIPGRLPDAIRECETALQIDPGLEPAQQLLKEWKTAQR